MAAKKNLGLDLIRIFAAFLVIVCHSGYFSIGISYAVVEYTGILAVDFFFVLSGLLVGKSLILAITDTNPGKKLKRFYINRIFRTLPLYYIMLFLNGWLKGESIPLSCFLFLHNFSETDLGFMPVAWSLSIETWFYFVIPPVFLILYRTFKKKHSPQAAVFCAIGVLYAIPLVLRILCVLLFDPAWDNGVRKQILLRLETAQLDEGNLDQAQKLADVIQDFVSLLHMHPYTGHMAQLLPALKRRDAARSLRCIRAMLDALQTQWTPGEGLLYAHSGVKKAGHANMLGGIIREMRESEEYAFLRENEEFNRLLADHTQA